MWKLWSKALGEKSSDKDHEADYVAILRTRIFTTYLITNMFIVAGVIRHWNNDEWKGGRVVYGNGLENRRGESLREFESHPFRIIN